MGTPDVRLSGRLAVTALLAVACLVLLPNPPVAQAETLASPAVLHADFEKDFKAFLDTDPRVCGLAVADVSLLADRVEMRFGPPHAFTAVLFPAGTPGAAFRVAVDLPPCPEAAQKLEALLARAFPASPWKEPGSGGGGGSLAMAHVETLPASSSHGVGGGVAWLFPVAGSAFLLLWLGLAAGVAVLGLRRREDRVDCAVIVGVFVLSSGVAALLAGVGPVNWYSLVASPELSDMARDGRAALSPGVAGFVGIAGQVLPRGMPLFNLVAALVWCSFLLSVVLVRQVALLLGSDRATARNAAILLAVFPVTPVLSVTDSAHGMALAAWLMGVWLFLARCRGGSAVWLAAMAGCIVLMTLARSESLLWLLAWPALLLVPGVKRWPAVSALVVAGLAGVGLALPLYLGPLASLRPQPDFAALLDPLAPLLAFRRLAPALEGFDLYFSRFNQALALAGVLVVMVVPPRRTGLALGLSLVALSIPLGLSGSGLPGVLKARYALAYYAPLALVMSLFWQRAGRHLPPWLARGAALAWLIALVISGGMLADTCSRLAYRQEFTAVSRLTRSLPEGAVVCLVSPRSFAGRPVCPGDVDTSFMPFAASGPYLGSAATFRLLDWHSPRLDGCHYYYRSSVCSLHAPGDKAVGPHAEAVRALCRDAEGSAALTTMGEVVLPAGVMNALTLGDGRTVTVSLHRVEK